MEEERKWYLYEIVLIVRIRDKPTGKSLLWYQYKIIFQMVFDSWSEAITWYCVFVPQQQMQTEDPSTLNDKFPFFWVCTEICSHWTDSIRFKSSLVGRKIKDSKLWIAYLLQTMQWWINVNHPQDRESQQRWTW